ncbi:hypothetical protein [Microbacterium sp. SORGH_AS_0428]|uniref:hypothetical protein n=1 Tax=Microbacterium sp. SORGH_AS_0428 TaxID=3041788 RepID=UPI00286D0ECF|nr:hypothetical protein [Microbacterium sp. SORGH_AS_0428]
MVTGWHKRGADPAELKALHPGVPSWMRRQIIMWADAFSAEATNSSFVSGNPDPAVLEDYETAVRRRESLVDGFSGEGAEYLLDEMGQDEFLDFVDYLVYRVSRDPDAYPDALDLLEDILQRAGSEWRVGERDGFASLEKRVPEGVSIAAAETISNSGNAGGLLAESWHAAFGKSPHTEEAYEKAIKAVEEAGVHIVTPKDSKSTLGKMISVMKSQKDWKLDLPTPDADVAIKMADALWVGQESRHGGNGYRKPTQAEAEAAVLLAVPLVQWFTSGALARR